MTVDYLKKRLTHKFGKLYFSVCWQVLRSGTLQFVTMFLLRFTDFRLFRVYLQLLTFRHIAVRSLTGKGSLFSCIWCISRCISAVQYGCIKMHSSVKDLSPSHLTTKAITYRFWIVLSEVWPMIFAVILTFCKRMLPWNPEPGLTCRSVSRTCVSVATY